MNLREQFMKIKDIIRDELKNNNKYLGVYYIRIGTTITHIIINNKVVPCLLMAKK